MDFISSASYSCSLKLLKIHMRWALAEIMNSRRRSSEHFVCIFEQINGDGFYMGNCPPSPQWVSVFPEITQPSYVFLIALQTSSPLWTVSQVPWAFNGSFTLGYGVTAYWRLFKVFPVEPVNGNLQGLQVPVSMTLLPTSRVLSGASFCWLTLASSLPL